MVFICHSFLNGPNKVNNKIDKNKFSHLVNNFYANVDTDCLSRPDVKKALHDIYEDFKAIL